MVWAESILKRFFFEEKDIRIEKLLIALNVAEKRLLTNDERLELFGEITDAPLVSDAEWLVLQMKNKELEEPTYATKEIQWSDWF